GSEFTVKLPALTRPVSLQRQVDRPRDQGNAPRGSVLVADDNVDYANSVAAILRTAGHDVRIAHDGLSAVATAWTSQPGIVLLDMGMPGIDGYEPARRLRRHPATRDATLIAITGWGQEKDMRQSQEAGFDYHLVKPVDPAQLLELVARSAATS